MTARVIAASPEAVTAAAEALGRGGLVILPTDTVYGIAADVRHDAAVARIPEAKGRPGSMPLQLLFAEDITLVGRFAELTAAARRWLSVQGPGGWTLILPARAGWSSPALAGGTTVAVRMPDSAVVRAVVGALGVPVAASSANRHGEPSPETCQAALASLGTEAAVAIDDGPARHGVDSTIINLSVEPPRILREGAISAAEVARTLGLATIETGS